MTQALTIKNVVMTGLVIGIELQELYSNAGCFILPSSHEGLPIALLEALSFGLPCIASDIEANKSIRHPNICAFSVHDISTLRRLMSDASGSGLSNDRMAARAFVFENYNWDTIVLDTYEIMKMVVAR